MKKYLEAAFIRLRGLKRKLAHETDTWWDNRNYRFLRDQFLREGVDSADGVNHPARIYLRSWLKRHPNLSLLDIPSGVGVEYEGFKRDKIPVKYQGMDMSDSIRRAFHERFPEAKIKAGTIQHMPLKDESYDVVLCRHILEHIPDYRHAVIEALRVSKKYVFLILFRAPTRTVRHEIGFGAWDNRLSLKDMKNFFRLLNVGVQIKTIASPAAHLEENTVILLTKNK